eukprot:1141895-Pelagomonas_calceolata.AAC.1
MPTAESDVCVCARVPFPFVLAADLELCGGWWCWAQPQPGSHANCCILSCPLVFPFEWIMNRAMWCSASRSRRGQAVMLLSSVTPTSSLRQKWTWLGAVCEQSPHFLKLASRVMQ